MAHLQTALREIEPRTASGPHEIDTARVAKYAAAMKRGKVFPPIRVVDYGDSYMIIDGHHRVAAAIEVGTSIPAIVAEGEAFEDLDIALRNAGKCERADDVKFWR